MQDSNGNDFKRETMDTVNQVKENMKNINLKDEANLGKGYLKELVEMPISKIKQIANDIGSKYFKTAILALVLWTVILLVRTVISNLNYFDYLKWYGVWYVIKNLAKNIITTIIVPLVTVVVMSAIIYVMNSKKNKPLTTVITTVITAKIPVILAKVVGLVTLISSSAYTIVSPITGLLGVISTVFMFFGIKFIFDIEDDNEAIKKFIIVEAIFYVAAFIISYLGISI